jgi:8-oxo-dGTP pyrophosphatase MutT (NUDIX family)
MRRWGIEDGETVEEAAAREVLEETGQHVINLQCHGVFKLKLARHNHSEYGALYTGTIDELRPFMVNDESDRIILRYPGEALDDPLSELSAWMITHLRRM